MNGGAQDNQYKDIQDFLNHSLKNCPFNWNQTKTCVVKNNKQHIKKFFKLIFMVDPTGLEPVTY